jgi:DNA-binding XRE family transcriptional regulator
MSDSYRKPMTPEERQDFHDKRFLVGKYASPSTPAAHTSPAVLKIGVLGLSEQEFRDMRFGEGKYASPSAYPRHSVFNQPAPPARDYNWVQDLRDKQAAQFKAEVKCRLQVMPSGQRIRNLRDMLGWTQGQAAKELGISRRTVIRHERGQHRTPWMRLSLLQRLRRLESEHEQQLTAYLGWV